MVQAVIRRYFSNQLKTIVVVFVHINELLVSLIFAFAD